MKTDTPIQRRTRAIIAFALLTGARDDAIASMSLAHVDLVNRVVSQDARDVRTKFRKTFRTWFFPVGGHAEAILADWVHYLRTELRFGIGDPLFPATLVGLGRDGKLGPQGFKREHWKNASAIRQAFRNGFVEAGLPYFNPHSIRATLTRLGQKLCKTPEEFKAWSQNLGHEEVLVTFGSYGHVEGNRQAEILEKMRNRGQVAPDQDTIAELEALVARMKTEARAA